ncbi:hypothetical protein ACIQ2D_05360 [Lysinibacillus sp. NPDC097287]|uniref:hypothetical protein n=1 Tax=Lysinibacillus sp. NPDC097287 TaxID=3364144 RepID=UPI00382A3E75
MKKVERFQTLGCLVDRRMMEEVRTLDETVLVKRAMAGDETSFLQVQKIYENTMHRTAYAY